MRLVIIEDHRITRELLCKACELELGHQIVGQAASVEEAVRVILRTLPDAVVLDIDLSGRDGFEVVERVRRMQCNPRFVILSAYCDPCTVLGAERANVDGFVAKEVDSVPYLGKALAAAKEGRRYFSEKFQSSRAALRKDPLAFDKLLTKQEQVVFELAAACLTDSEISGRTRKSVRTVGDHRLNILHKLGLASNLMLVHYARTLGFGRRRGP